MLQKAGWRVVFGMNDFTVRLPADERTTLLKLLTTGTAAARKLLYARILLKADRSQAGPALTDPAIAKRSKPPRTPWLAPANPTSNWA